MKVKVFAELVVETPYQEVDNEVLEYCRKLIEDSLWDMNKKCNHKALKIRMLRKLNEPEIS